MYTSTVGSLDKHTNTLTATNDQPLEELPQLRAAGHQ